jgi:hypothetical protein
MLDLEWSDLRLPYSLLGALQIRFWLCLRPAIHLLHTLVIVNTFKLWLDLYSLEIRIQQHKFCPVVSDP